MDTGICFGLAEDMVGLFSWWDRERWKIDNPREEFDPNKPYHITVSYVWVIRMLFLWSHRKGLFPPATFGESAGVGGAVVYSKKTAQFSLYSFLPIPLLLPSFLLCIYLVSIMWDKTLIGPRKHRMWEVCAHPLILWVLLLERKTWGVAHCSLSHSQLPHFQSSKQKVRPFSAAVPS